MTSRLDSTFWCGLLPALAFGALAGALVSPAAAQNYLYGQAGLATGPNPSGVAVADFNGDGRLDLATANQGVQTAFGYQAGNAISVILSQPDGIFAPKVDYPVGNTPVQIVAADFNGDGIVDLAVTNQSDNTLSLLFGFGDGTFKSQTTIPVGTGPTAIAAGDFDGDRNVDLAVGNQDGTLSILMGDGKGGFTSQTPVSIGGSAYFMLAGDSNNDGKDDLYVAVGSSNSNNSTSQIVLLTSTGNRTFSAPYIIYGASANLPGGGPSIPNLTLGDFNNDGNLDLTFAFTSTAGVSNAYVYMGNGKGAYTSNGTIPLGAGLSGPVLAEVPVSVAAADFNRDGNLDLALVGNQVVEVYPGNGSGVFGSPVLGGVATGGVANGPQQLVVAADFNNDGFPDLAVLPPVDSVAIILLGNGDGSLGAHDDVTLPQAAAVAAAVIADFNHDGKLDFAVTEFNQPNIISGFVTSLLGNGDGSFQAPVSTPSREIGIAQLVSGDFTGTGNMDLISGDVDANGGIALFPGKGDGSFGSPIESFQVGSSNPMNLNQIAVGDFNGDGKMDFAGAVTGTASNYLYIFLSQGNGTFTPTLLCNVPYGVASNGLAVADFNHDGFLDIATFCENLGHVGTGDQLSVFPGRGDGTFQKPVIYPVSLAVPDLIVAGDFNGDGKIDLVAGGYYSGSLFFYAGNGDGTFHPAVSTPPSINLSGLVAADFNGDGHLDLADASLDFIFPGNGDGTFQAGIPFQPTLPMRSWDDGAFGDLNGDGIVDLVRIGANENQTTATVWLGTPSPAFSASSLHFGAQNVGTSSSPQAIQLSNAGNAPLELASISAGGDFSQTNTCGTTLKLKDGCSVQVTFRPTANGPRNGSLTFTMNGKPATRSLPLQGWAGSADFVASVSPGSVTVNAGSSATYSLALASGDGFVGAVQISCSGVPSLATCTLSSQSVQIAANGTARVQVTVRTTAPSSAAVYSAPRAPLPPTNRHPLAPASALACLVLFSMRRRARLVSAFALCLVFWGCGGGGSTSTPTGPPPVSGTPAGTYTLTLTMTSANSTHSLKPTLVVQ